ncbi:glycosyltransferase family 2 protein [Tolypothrix campylonemoides VB511288]|nr:glycosyltransferase family 2 protein [Tolypothrix campylonemoides VB511288]
MNVISRIQFPSTPETSDLYIKCSEGAFLNFCKEDVRITLNKNAVLCLNTYFNSFYEKFYAKYTKLESVYYLLKLEGDFQVGLYRERYGQDNSELIYNKNFENCKLEEPIKIVLPDSWRREDAGRVYLEIMCLSDQGCFTEGYIATEQNPVREVSLGIISCTFRKEAYIKKTVNAILNDNVLHGKKLKIFVVDNGKTLKKDDFPNQKFELISNRNVGGSGGFTRGLIQALQEDVYSHFLFMDDDIELDTESIYRLFSLYEYAKQDFAIAGSMLDLYEKHMLYEAGALYNKRFDSQGNLKECRPFKLTLLNNNLDLRNPTSLNLLLQENNVDYGAFWFFCFSKEVVENIGLPMPFFIKGDDVEFGLRVKKHLGNAIVAFPSLAVWHEPFYAKKAVWDVYYACRNLLITDSIYGSLRYLDAVLSLTKNIIIDLLLFDYNSAILTIKGFEDYMRGPDFIKSNDPEKLHSDIVKYSKIHHSQAIVANPVSNSEKYHITRAGKFKILLTLLTLNGHFLPSFLIKNESATIRYGSKERDSLCKGFAKKRIVYILEKNSNSYQNELDNLTGIKLLFLWLKYALISCLRWSSVTAKWKNYGNELTSIHFWQDYLEPNK